MYSMSQTAVKAWRALAHNSLVNSVWSIHCGYISTIAKQLKNIHSHPPSLWSDDGSLDANLVPWFEGEHSGGFNVPQQLTVTEPHPVSATLLLPVGLYIQVLEAITVNLDEVVG